MEYSKTNLGQTDDNLEEYYSYKRDTLTKDYSGSYNEPYNESYKDPYNESYKDPYNEPYNEPYNTASCPGQCSEPYSKATEVTSKKLLISKRAAQNRAAQKAFRERKALHIKELEYKARLLASKDSTINALQGEIISLRSRLSELEIENSHLRRSTTSTNQQGYDYSTLSQRCFHSNDGKQILSSDSNPSNLFEVNDKKSKFLPTIPLKDNNSSPHPSNSESILFKPILPYQCPDYN